MRMFGGVPANTFVGTPRTSVSWISNMVPGAHTAAQASWKLIDMVGCVAAGARRRRDGPVDSPVITRSSKPFDQRRSLAPGTGGVEGRAARTGSVGKVRWGRVGRGDASIR